MTAKMNFGPEWMRGGSGDISTRNSLNSSENIEDKKDDTHYKYSKEYMLSLYTPTADTTIPHSEHYPSIASNTPLMCDNFRDNSDKPYSFGTQFNTPFEPVHELRRSSEIEEEPLWGGVDKDNIGTFDNNGVFRLGGGGFEVSLEESPKQKKEPFDLDFSSAPFVERIADPVMNFTVSKDDRWEYRDPSGIVRGPFTALEMQEWFEAGFFSPALLVKRKDALSFEPLSSILQKANDPQNPFETSYENTLFQSYAKKSNTTQINGPDPFNRPPVGKPSHFMDAAQSAFKSASLFTPEEPPLLSSPWQSVSTTWLSHQRDPVFNGAKASNQRQRHQSHVPTSSIPFQPVHHDISRQQVMNQHIEQQYLSMLRMNQQHHLEMQQRMLQQQQQHVLLQQQSIYSPQHATISPPPPIPPLTLHHPMTPERGWNSVPGTPNHSETFQHPWNTHSITNGSIIEAKLPVVDDEADQKIAFALKELSISEPKQPKEMKIVEEPVSMVTTLDKSSLRDGKLEQKAMIRDNKKSHSASAWSSAVGKTVPSKPSRSTSTSQQPAAITSIPIRQKHASMNASIPTPTQTSANSRHPTIESKPKSPSQDFLTWCKFTLRGLNAGVNEDEILQMLLSFPADNSCSEIIQDVIYANSTSMDGRRFAHDFITKRRADMEGKLDALPKMPVSSEFKVVTTKRGKKNKQSHA